MIGWQSWQSAPKDGKWIIARCNDRSMVVRLCWGRNRENQMAWCSATSWFGDGLFEPSGGWIPDPADERWYEDEERCIRCDARLKIINDKLAVIDDQRDVLAEIKDIALTVKPADVPKQLAHIVRLCIDAINAPRSRSHIHDERQASSPLTSELVGDKRRSASVDSAALAQSIEPPSQSAPPILTPRRASPSGERLPSSDAAVGGADTSLALSSKDSK